MPIKFRRGLSADRTSITPESGEPIWTTDTNSLYIGDGGTPGGILVAASGDVTGPSSSTNNHVVFFNGTTGKVIKDSGLTLSGTNTGDQTITLTGDVTGSGTGSFAASISAGSVTLAKMANLSANSIIGNNTGSAATPIALSGTNVTAMLDAFSSTLKGLAPASGGGTTNFLRADGTWAAPPNSGGTVTSVSALTLGTSGTDLSSSVANGTTTPVITLNVPDASATNRGALTSTDWSTFNGKESVLTFSTGLSRVGNTITNTITQYTDADARLAISDSVTGLDYNSTTGVWSTTSGYGIPTTASQTDWDTAYTNRITSLTTTGSSGSATLVSNTLNIPTYTLAGLGGQPLATNLTSLSGLTYASASFVKMTAAGTFSLDTATYLTGNQTITLSGDVSGSGSTSITASIGANKVTVSMLAQAAANSILGNNTGSPANVAYLTGTQVTAMLDTFTSTLKGLTPASGGGTTKFLRADGTWAALAYTFSTGLTESAGTVTANISTGVAGGQTVIGGTAASNNLTLSSTSNATKGKVILGTSSAYDEANDRLGIGTTSPSYGLHIVKSSGTSLFIDSTASGSTALQANGTTTVTSGTTPHVLIQLTSSPVANSSAGSRSLYMRHNLNASTINFTGSAQNGPTSAWFENRIINAGTITSILGSFTSGLLMGGDAVTCGTVTDAVGIRAIGLNSFSNSVANTVTNSRAFYAHNAAKNTSTLTNQVGLNVEALSAATNNTAILLGTTTIPSGNFAIYSAGTETSYFAGSVQIADKDLIFGTTTGTKIGTATGQKLAFWNKTPIVQPTTSLSVSLTFTANTGTAVNDASTFGGYTLKQIAQALINIGILA